jgi:hypothetical protein
MKVGDLVVIRNPDIIESFLLRKVQHGEVLHGILVELETIDPDRPQDDVWIVLVNDQLYKMLRWEFDPYDHRRRSYEQG